MSKEAFTRTRRTYWQSKDLGEFFHKGNKNVERESITTKILSFRK